jgi:glutamine---fructose-6-phosphate transaminase (isomerizing)
LFVGMGTSFHAARASAWAAGPAWDYRQPFRAIDSFDLLLEPELVQRAGAAIVFSSSGETALTLRAQDALRSAHVPQVLVTGTERSRSVDRADHALFTKGAVEQAWVHTVSYTTAIAAALTLLRHWSGNRSVCPPGIDRSLRTVIRREPEWRKLATRLEDRSKFLLLGSGPAEATAREASLKLREGAARFAATAGIEEFLHGILPSIDADRTAVLAIATSPLDRRRAITALTAAARAGAEVALFARGRPDRKVENEFELPKVSLPQTPLVDIAPFQFLTYWLAVSAGRNPDVMGFDDPRILDARRTYGI